MSALIDVFKNLRRSKDGALSCPQCGGVVRRSRSPLEGWILPVRYICAKCGYNGFLAMEDESELSTDTK